MTRILLPLLAAVALTAATAPRPWTAVATPVASGSYLIGNPKARVKLVEYVSYTCPHCAHFTQESDATLGAMVRSGSTSVELRNQVHDGIDLAAATLARCSGAAAFPRVHAAFSRSRSNGSILPATGRRPIRRGSPAGRNSLSSPRSPKVPG
ncbi:thioredoxin domain-containing protein [Sphingomonas sp. LR60]|uniref:thioredoxin domain-containing protein n=1 Tax=Sphingomonas sp. LR60 TaxID=3050233 RepID=UPI002FE0130B